MIVNRENFATVLKELKDSRRKLAVDTETTGLRPYGDSRLFSIAIASSSEDAFYFNFNMAQDIPDECILGLYHAEALDSLLSRSTNYLFLHNAKFDWAILEKDNINLEGRIHDTMVVERLLHNNSLSLSLENCAKRIGFQKDSAVEDYITKHKLYTDKIERHKEIRDKHYDQVPLDIIAPYALTDVKITHALGTHQLQEIAEIDTGLGLELFSKLLKNEFQLLKTVYAMENRGVLIDKDYCERAYSYEQGIMQEIKEKIEKEIGRPFVDSAKTWTEVFKDEKIQFGKETATGKVNPKFDNYSLQLFANPLVAHIIAFREAKKRSDFYVNFLYFADRKDILHASFNQAGTGTGRFSGFDPNLQQLKKDSGEEAKAEFLVRRAIIPRPGFMFLMLDYEQVEYKLMLDIAGSMGLINKIKEGLDVHQATADLANISRQDAKTVNFAILYGAGAAKIAKSLGISEGAAKLLKYAVLNASPEIGTFIQKTIGNAKRGGLLTNWYGRRYIFEDPQFAYRGPNHIVQGGSADVMKIAMNRIHAFLENRESKMVMTIHDEIVIELSKKEKFLVPKLKSIMESVYPGKHLQLTCSVEYSETNLADKRKLGNEV